MSVHPSCNLLRPAVAAAFLFLGVSELSAATRKNPVSKLYVATLEGEAEINDGERVHELSEKSVYTATGTVIQTKPGSQQTMVFSNGSGVFFDQETLVEIDTFIQEPFIPNRTDLEVEPSISQTAARIRRGSVGLCTSRPVAGSSMVYATPHARVNVRGSQVVIETNEFETRVSLVNGDVTVEGGTDVMGGRQLQAGEQAIIRREPGRPPVFIVQSIPEAELAGFDEQVSKACMARRTVYFEVADRGENGEEVSAFDEISEEQVIEPVPVVPVEPPIEHTVSASALPSSAGQ